MTFTVKFIERKYADTPSIEVVFRRIAEGLEREGVRTVFEKLPYGNSFGGMIRNLISYRANETDLFHITGHSHYIGLVLPPARTVLTIHDLGILRLRKGIRRWLIKKLLFEWPVSRLRFITVISAATKQELIEATDCDEAKIRVIGNPAPETAKRQLRALSDPPVILQVGTAPHKNLERVAEALEGVSCRLRIVGKLGKEQSRLLDAYRLRFDSIGPIGDAEMAKEYSNADLLVFCSTFEGFGMPVIEAQAAGLPVITSDLEPMREVAGEGALLVDPFDSRDIRAAILGVLGNEKGRQDLIDRGYENVARFAQERIVGEYYQLYRRILGS